MEPPMQPHMLGGSIYPEQASLDSARDCPERGRGPSRRTKRVEGYPSILRRTSFAQDRGERARRVEPTTSLIPRQALDERPERSRRALRVNAPHVKIQAWAHLVPACFPPP